MALETEGVLSQVGGAKVAQRIRNSASIDFGDHDRKSDETRVQEHGMTQHDRPPEPAE
jgi:hypothetical protein